MADSKTIELVAFKGSDYSKSNIRNVELYFYYPNYNLQEDLIVIELTNQNERKNYIKEKNSSNIKRFFIPKQLINEVDNQFYKFEIYLDKAELTSKEFSNEEILIRCSVLKNYAENATLENLKIDTEKPLFEFPENTIKNKTQIYSASGRSDKSKIKKLIDTRGINIDSYEQVIKNEKESVDEKKFNNDSSESSISFDEDFYRIFVNFALLLANADGQLTSDEEESITDLAPTYLNKNKIRGILNVSKMEYQKNNITFSALVYEVNQIYKFDEKKTLLNSLYMVSVADGNVDPEELKLLELIADNIGVDFQSIKKIRRATLEKVKYQKIIEDFSDLEINFNASIGEQIEQAKYQMWLWNSRLAIPNDPRTITEYQLLIDKYSRFLSNQEKQGHKIIDDDRKNISFDNETTYRRTSEREEYDYDDDEEEYDYDDDDEEYDYDDDDEEYDYEVYENYDLIKLKKYSKENFSPPPPTTDIRVMEKRKKHKRAYARWSDDEEEFLVFLYDEKDYDYKTIADILQRQTSAITARLSKLGFIEDHYDYWS